MSVVRVSSEQEVKEIANLAAEMQRQSVFSGIPFDMNRVVSYGMNAVANPNSYAMFLYKTANGESVGFVAGYVSCLWYCPERKILADFGFYVREDHRGSMAGIRLIKAYEKWAKENGVDCIEMGISAGIDNEKAERFYKGIGYSHAATVMTKEI